MSNNSSAIYLFCFAQRHRLPDLEAADLGQSLSVSLWPFKDIVAVLGMSSIEEFCGPEAEDRMKDLAWIGPRACRHEAVLEKVMRHSPVFPARFGTIFSSFDALKELLDIHYDEISGFLDKAAGKEEWAVKGLLNRAQARKDFLDLMFSSKEGELAALSPGKRYLAEKQIRGRADSELNNWLKGVIKGIGNKLCRHSVEFCERKVLSSDSKDMDSILNWAFWVTRENEDDFQDMINKVNGDNEHQGLLLQLSGPWPPYSFLPCLDSVSVNGDL
jgi:hypothetical protein